MRYLVIIATLLIVGVGLLAAQETPRSPDDVPFDEVNEVASKMYCPVCENEPLDTCGAVTCIEWREEIRQQLAQGRTPDQVIDYFVGEYGERVVGIPEDNTLRTFALIAPIIVVAVAIFISRSTILRWRDASESSLSQSLSESVESSEQDDYRERLEEDLKL